MTIWTPQLTEDPGGAPLYKALSSEIAEAVARGDLEPGDRLPTQRALSRRLGIALTTVTRAYAEAERRGLVRGEVGRGTFVRGARRSSAEDARIDLQKNSLLPHGMLDVLTESMARIVGRAEPETLLAYGPHGGIARHREAGAAWLGRSGVEAHPDDVLVTAGVQHGMAVVFSTLLEPGDRLLVERYTYAGMKALANLLRVRLVPIRMDDEGLMPDALEDACRDGASALYCMSTLQNPLTTVMSEARRREVSAVLERHGVPLVEDGSYVHADPGHPPIATFCERAYYLDGTSKSIFPSLRIGYVHAPAGEACRVEAAISSTAYLASPLTAEVAAEWIGDGTADRVLDWKRMEMAARTQIVADLLGDYEYVSPPVSPHAWLRLPEPWTARDFTAQAAQQGVDVAPADEFAVGRDAEHAVRICVGPPLDRAQLEKGARRLLRVLGDPPDPIRTIA